MINREFQSDTYEEEERYLREILAILHRDYTKAAKPYLDRLVAIRSCRPLPPILLTLEQAQSFGLVTPNKQDGDCK